MHEQSLQLNENFQKLHVHVAITKKLTRFY